MTNESDSFDSEPVRDPLAHSPNLDKARNHQSLEDLDDVILDGLLTGYFESDESREERVQLTLRRYDQWVRSGSVADEASFSPQPNSKELDDVVVSSAKRSRRGRQWYRGLTSGSRRVRRLVVIIASLSAALLFALGGWYTFQPSPLQASMDRVLDSTQDVETRLYNVEVRRPGSRRFPVRTGQIYSRSTDEFVAVFESPRRPSSVMGGNADRRWMIVGDRIWRSDSEDQLPGDVLFDQATMRSLRMNGLLTSLPKNFELKLLDEEELPGAVGVRCRPILATRKRNRIALPLMVKIWPHPRTGVVHRMIVRQGRPGFASRSQTVTEFQYQGRVEVDGDFFELDYHRSSELGRIVE